MNRILIATAALLLLPFAWAPAGATTTLVVGPNPGEYHTIQAAVDAASPGDTIVIGAGVYQEEVGVSTPGLTIRGVDRESVILDGGGVRGNAFTVVADNVTLASMTARDYAGNGFVFSHVIGCHFDDLHAIDNAEYGLYAVHSQKCVMENSFASGHGDSGFYLGETVDCDCDVQNNVGWDNMLGYSGTANSHIRIHHNEFMHNRAGILLSVLPTEMGVDVCAPELGMAGSPGDACPGVTAYGLQTRTEIYENYIHDNNDHTYASGIYGTVHPPVGEGIVVSGGWNNEIHHNRIENNHLWGVGIFWLTTEPRGNYVHDNEISGGRYGIWWDEWGEDHCFANNNVTNVRVVSDPAVLPTCPGPAGDLPCPAAVGDYAACRANDPLPVRPMTALKDAQLAWRSYYDLDPSQDFPAQTPTMDGE